MPPAMPVQLVKSAMKPTSRPLLSPLCGGHAAEYSLSSEQRHQSRRTAGLERPQSCQDQHLPPPGRTHYALLDKTREVSGVTCR